MGHEEELARLEQFVEQLLNSYDALKADHRDVQKRLLKSEQANQELQKSNEALQGDRDIIHTRVSSLIGRIEDWEKGQNGSGKGTASSRRNEETMPIFAMGTASQGES